MSEDRPRDWFDKRLVKWLENNAGTYLNSSFAAKSYPVSMLEQIAQEYETVVKERDEAKAALKKLEGVLKHGGEKLASKTVAFKYMIEERDSLKREMEQARQEAGEYYHRGLNDRGDEVAALKAEIEKLKQIIKDHDAKGNDCPDLEGV